MTPVAPPQPMPLEGPNSIAFWRSQITAAEQQIQAIAAARHWDDNIQAYLGKGLATQPSRDTVWVNKDFTLVEAKKALLFFQTPDVAARAEQPAFEDAAPLVAAVVNCYLSPSKTHAKAMVDEVLMDVLCPAGIGVSKIGYEAFADPQQPEVTVPHPANPDLPALGPDGQPLLAPNLVRERYFWNRIPPKQFLYPPTWHGSDFDTAPWIGFRYELDRVVAERQYQLREDVGGTSDGTQAAKDLLSSDVSRASDASATPKVTLHEIWYRASDVDPLIGDPEIVRQLVFLEGRELPLVHRDSPYQVIAEGRWVRGMRGYPVHPLTLRYVSDQAIPPSDCTISRQQVDELSKGRSQMIQQRDRAVPLVIYDTSRLPEDAVQKAVKGETQELIGVPGLDIASPPAMSLPRGQYGRENFTFNDIIDRDIAEYWSLGPNQRGVDTDTQRTATELAIMQSATDTRMDAERAKVLHWFARGCEKLLSLIQLFADADDYARIVGPDGVERLQVWSKADIAGSYSLSLAPDSAQRLDAVADRKRALDVFGLLGNDPLIDPVELRKWLVLKLGMDANKLVKPPQPKGPEPPQVSVAIKGEDLAPTMPQYVNVATLLAARGIGVAPPQPMQLPPGQPPTNPGGVPPVSPLNKRFADQSGQLPGGGQTGNVGGVAA